MKTKSRKRKEKMTGQYLYFSQEQWETLLGDYNQSHTANLTDYIREKLLSVSGEKRTLKGEKKEYKKGSGTHRFNLILPKSDWVQMDQIYKQSDSKDYADFFEEKLFGEAFGGAFAANNLKLIKEEDRRMA